MAIYCIGLSVPVGWSVGLKKQWSTGIPGHTLYREDKGWLWC